MHYETRFVLAGAYKKSSPGTFLSHTVATDDVGRERVLCKRVKLESLADPEAGDSTSRPTCQTCARWDGRFQV